MLLLLLLLLLRAPAHPQDLDPFAGEENALARESELAEQGGPGALSLRLRAQGTPGQTRQYQRLEWKGHGQEAYVLVERDPGEPRWNDFAAGYCHWHHPARPFALTAGDLRPGLGQGLIFGRTSGRGAPFPALRQDRQNPGYRASGENAALRGVALSGGAGSFEAVLLAGRAARDARIDKGGQVVSLPESGLHRTRTEETGRRLLGIWVGGARLRWAGRSYQWGATLQALRFDRRVDLRRKEDRAFHGQAMRLTGTDFRLQWRGLRAAGEAGVDARGRRGALGVGTLRLGRLRLGATWRRYDPDFPAFFGGALGRTGQRDEEGLLLCAEGRWQGWQGRLWADGWRPVQADHQPLSQVRGWSLIPPLRPSLRLELSGQQEPGQGGRARLSLAWNPYRRLELAARIEERRLRAKGEAAEQGRLFSWRASGNWHQLEWTCHLSHFHTSSYASRIYEYERDLPGALSIRPLYGKGWRWYLLAAYHWRVLRLSGRYRFQQGRHHAGLQLDLEWLP
ncbi:MAG: hypothetical protein HYW07_08135 [Candidatus Latescibacteria bacterium]|nr:hypothetical protein [Candidatus Latescibacterota bacterium]